MIFPDTGTGVTPGSKAGASVSGAQRDTRSKMCSRVINWTSWLRASLGGANSRTFHRKRLHFGLHGSEGLAEGHLRVHVEVLLDKHSDHAGFVG